MRVIKFRAWDHKESVIILPEDLLTINQNRYLNQSLLHDDTLTFMQFTGFQDSRGTDIYEGDILYVAGFGIAKAIITYEHGSEFEDATGHHRSMINAAAEDNIGEILGNIYEQPILLNSPTGNKKPSK